MKRILRASLCLLGAFLLINAIVMFFTSNFNLGLVCELAIGAVLLLYGVFFYQLSKRIPLWLSTLFFAGIAAVMALAAFLLSFGVNNTVTGEEDAIVVLGCGIRGEVLTQGLKNRLDAAIDCYEDNEDAVMVVSGGQGPQEDIPEALAMERYLLSQGIPQQQIIKEERATSTYENFLFSKELLDEHFGEEYTLCFVSNEYHIYRASSLAKIAGVAQTTHAHSDTLWYTLIPSSLRECLAVMKMWVFGK